MKNNRVLWAALLLSLPLTMWGQSGMYSMSSKKSKAKVERIIATQAAAAPSNVEIIYADDNELPVTSGPVRDVDEYNRRGPRYTTQADSLAYPMDTTYLAVTQGQLTDLYSKGYSEGYSDGEDYGLTRRMTRFGYASIYCSPWYWSIYDPFYWDDWYWYGGWSRPYWGYYGGYYDPYWYGYRGYGYYGWHRPYYHGGYYHHGGGHPRDYVTNSGRRPGQTGRMAGSNRGNSRYYGGRNTGFTGGRVTGAASSRSGYGSSRSTVSAPARSSSSSSARSSSTFSGASSRSSSPSYSGSTRSSGSSFGGSSFGGSRSGGGGGGFTGGSRGGGGGRGR